MMTSRMCSVFVVAVGLCSLVLAGCSRQPEPGKTGDTATPTASTETRIARPAVATGSETATPATPVSTGTGSTLATAEIVPLEDVFFAFDKATIGSEQRRALDAGIAWLLAHPAVTVTIEGHCDEHGTAEYNLSLGERRAKAVQDALLEAGVPAERVRTVSYGEERPFASGHDRSAWKVNRRAHFVLAER